MLLNILDMEPYTTLTEPYVTCCNPKYTHSTKIYYEFYARIRTRTEPF